MTNDWKLQQLRWKRLYMQKLLPGFFISRRFMVESNRESYVIHITPRLVYPKVCLNSKVRWKRIFWSGQTKFFCHQSRCYVWQDVWLSYIPHSPQAHHPRHQRCGDPSRQLASVGLVMEEGKANTGKIYWDPWREHDSIEPQFRRIFIFQQDNDPE